MFLIEEPSYRGFCALSAINTSSGGGWDGVYSHP